MLGRDQAAIRPHPRLMPARLVEQYLARTDQAPLDEVAERDARGLAPRFERQRLACRRADFRDAPARDDGVGRVALDPDKPPAEPLGDRTRGAGAEKRVEHDIAGPGRGEQHAVQQRLGLLRRMRLFSIAVAQAFRPAA